MNKLLCCCAAVLAVSGVSSHAQESSLNPVVVTATRVAQTENETLAAVTVITRKDIEKSQATNVQELLRGLPGVDFAVSGGYGKETYLFLRGTNAGHTLVLINGVKVGSATAGAPTLQFLPVSEIERIEIVRGPRSSLYGSEAIGGVIQIFTRKGNGPLVPRAEIMLGSLHTNETSAGVSGGSETSWFNIHAGRYATRGIDARPIELEPDHDGVVNRYGSFRFGYRLATKTEIEIHGLHSNGNTEYDIPAPSANETNFKNQAGGIQLRTQPTSVWHTSIQSSASRDDSLNFRGPGSSVTRFETKRRMLSWQNDFTLADRQLLTVGYDKQEDLVRSTTDFAKTSRENDAVFALYQGGLYDHDWQASVRHDDNEQFGEHNTGSVAYGYALSPKHRVFISYGTAFRAPGFSDLYWPGPFSAGNPNLKPEESKSYEIGVSGKSVDNRWAIQVFRTEIENLIVLTGPLFLPTNVNHATISGVELLGSTHVGNWDFSGNFTYLDPTDETTGNYLKRRSRHIAKVDIDRQIGNTEIGAGLVAHSERYENEQNTIRLGGYTIFNLRAQHRFSRDWKLGGRIENATDKEYRTVDGYNSVGRAYYMTLSYQPLAQ